MPGTATLSLDSVSVLLVWTAIAIYALAFIAYAVDLARRGAQAVEAKDAATRERELVSVAAAGAAASVVSSSAGSAGARLRDEERAAEAALRRSAEPATAPGVGAHRHVADGARASSSTSPGTSPAASPPVAFRGRTCTSSPSPGRCSSWRSTSCRSSATTCDSSARSSPVSSCCCSAGRRSRSTSRSCR